MGILSRLLLLLLLFGGESARAEFVEIRCESETQNSSIVLKNGTKSYKFKWFKLGELFVEWDFDKDEVLNNGQFFFRLYKKTFGIFNWESLDFRLYKNFEIVSILYKNKETGWGFKSVKQSEEFISDLCIIE